MKRFFQIGAVACMALLMTAPTVAQAQGEKKPHTFHGKVEKVSDDGLTVNGEKVEGWMDAMTMKYKVDNKKVLKTVKPGDEITATVYDGDLSLHKVQVVSKPAK
jgi:ribosomal protein S1